MMNEQTMAFAVVLGAMVAFIAIVVVGLAPHVQRAFTLVP